MRVKQTILFLLLNFVCSFAQAPSMEWFRAQGTNTEEHVHEGMQTSDSGFIAIGHGIETSESDDMLIIKTDRRGFLEWSVDFGTANKKGAGYCILEITDGFVAGGAIYNEDSNRTQRFLTKLDLAGNVIWQKYYPSDGVGGIRGIDLTHDEGFIVTGYNNTPSTNEYRGFVFIVDDGEGFLMKLDSGGNVLWENSFDAPQGTKVRTLDTGYVICSCVWVWNSQTGDQQDFCLIITDDQGNTLSRKLYGGDKSDHLYDFDLTADGGYILGGHTLSFGVENWDYLLMKIDSEGNEEWHKTFGQPRGYDANYIHDESYGVKQTPDGGYIICGGSGDEYSYSASGHYSGPSDEWKVFLVRTNSKGEIQWEGIYPSWSVGNNGGEYIGLTNDGGYIVFVDTDSKSYPEPNNFGFMKIASDQVTNIDEIYPSNTKKLKLYQNFPNPFNPTTIIKYSIPEAGNVKIRVYNILGVEINRLVEEYMNIGEYSIQINGNNLPSGLYVCRLQTRNYSKTIKMILIK